MKNPGRNTAYSAGMVRGWIVPLLAALALAGCDARSETGQQGNTPPEVDVARVQPESVTVTEVYTGRVEAPETVELRPRVSGYIKEVAFEEGEMVEAGDLLFRIDPRPYEARLEAARAELSRARSELQLADSEASRAERLLESRAISREEYDQRQAARLAARARVDAARAALETAELDQQYTRVIAPVTGRAGRALVTRGNLARADQTLLTTLVSVDPLHVYFDGDEGGVGGQYLPDNGETTAVRIGLDGDDAFPHRGELDFVDNRVNADTGTLQYRAVLPNPDGELRPGQFARVEMPVARMERALLVNRKAVLTDQDRRFVYVVDADDKVARRRVTAGRQVDELVVIRQGLENGDRVIVNGTQKIFGAGMKVTTRRVAMRDGHPVERSAVAAVQP